MRCRWVATIGLPLLTVASLGGSASAQETSHGGAGAGDLYLPHSDALVDPTMRRSWSEGNPRFFAATTIDAGYLYLRPRGHIGYGLPFHTWLGIEANPAVSGAGLGLYGGVRLQFPYVDLRVGARYFSAFQHAYLPPQAEYSRLDLDLTSNAKASFYTLEADATGGFPLGPGDVTLTGSISSVGNVPEGLLVFEETLRVVVDPPLVWRGRADYLFRFGGQKQNSIGPVVEALDVPKRDDSLTLRAGPVVRIQLSRHFEVRGSFVTTIFSPDALGLVGGDFTELGVRYRTATD